MSAESNDLASNPQKRADDGGRRRPALNNLRPSEFMRARHPDLFSDSEVNHRPYLDRAVFDHYLETLTNRKEEIVFERFARKLAEKEICPNLVPQTGPTGGGDSKVDTETYPVSEEIALRWYEAQSEDAARERWGFAFSIKRAWKAKVKADVANIASTHRGYTRVYFITNQYVRDKDRGAIQDELRAEDGFDVQILDRSWIIEKVFANRREDLAIETLGMQRPLNAEVKKGPRDTRREAELTELESQITDTARYQGIEYQLVEDCLQSALLARGLERARIEIDGRFDRAIRVADRHGTRQQQLRATYHHAWTTYWWFEDYTAFQTMYRRVENLARDSAHASDIELLKNLWHLLHTAVESKQLARDAVDLPSATRTVREELERLRQDEGRPNASLQARVHLVFMDMVLSRGDRGLLNAALEEFQGIFERSKGLIDFPARQIIDLLMELGEEFPSDVAFDELFEVVLPLAQERDSSATAGLMLLRRGKQKLEKGEPYEAIRLLGRAHQKLALHECRENLIAALALCAQAYERAGLFWAARASALVAASQALREFWEHGEFTHQAFACLQRLVWLELQLGRVPHVLALIETVGLFGHVIRLDTDERASVAEERQHADFILGLLLLKTDLFDLKALTRLPVVLERFRLDFAWIALLYALGHEDRLRRENIFPESDTPKNVRTAFIEALRTVEDVDLPLAPMFLAGRKVEMQSIVLGSTITAELPNQDRPLFFAEAILAALEALLATSMDAEFLPYAPKLRLTFIPVDFPKKLLEWIAIDEQRTIEIRYAADESVDLLACHDLVAELVISITAHVAFPRDNRQLEALFRDEQAMGRAMMLTKTGLMLRNVLGGSLKIRQSDWEAADGEEFPLRRDQPWGPGVPPEEKRDRPLIFGSGEPPPEMFDTERLKHRDRKVVSLINLPLWEKAGWTGAGFVVVPDTNCPPILALVFKNGDEGRKIFEEWLREIGSKDDKDRLRVTILTGVDRKHPAHYRVIVGSNDAWNGLHKGAHVVMVNRLLTVTPDSSENLDRFVTRYQKCGACMLAPGHVVGRQSVPDIDFRLMISLRLVNIRPAWEIREHDPDVCGIYVTDEVIIPDNVEDAPIVRAMEIIRKRRMQAPPGSSKAQPAPGPKLGRNDPCHCGSGKKFKKCHGR